MNLEELRKIIDEFIEENFIIVNTKGCLNLHNNKIIINKYKNKYKNIFTPSEYLYIFKNKNNINQLLNEMFCKCGNKNKFINQSHGYYKHCCYKCRSKDENVKQKVKQTNLKHWGVEYNFQSEYTKNQSKQTKLEKYGNENYNNRNKAKQTWLNKYNVDNPNKCRKVREKLEQTNLEKYGVKCNWSSKDSKLNGSQTKLEKYGNYNYYASQQFLNKYNNKIWLENKNKKYKQTCLEKYGVSRYSQTQEFKIKRYNTMKKNNSFNKSIQEEKCYQLLLNKFDKNDIIRQYKSESYPFACDFYIKSLDLYIEYHGTWTHGNKPFKNSIEDLQKLEELKNKNTKYYNNVIYTWTNLDIRKLNTFKKNKLNYKIFYKIKQFKNWFNKI